MVDRTLPLFPTAVLLKDMRATQAVSIPRDIKTVVPIPVQLSCGLRDRHPAQCSTVGRLQAQDAAVLYSATARLDAAAGAVAFRTLGQEVWVGTREATSTFVDAAGNAQQLRLDHSVTALAGRDFEEPVLTNAVSFSQAAAIAGEDPAGRERQWQRLFAEQADRAL